MRRFVIMAIFAAMLLSAISCGESQKAGNANDLSVSNEPNDPASENNQGEQEEATSETRVLSEAPEKDFEGYEYRILSRGESYALWEGVDAYSEEENGDPINDSVYLRNRIIEDRYNIRIANKPSSDILPSAKKAIAANTDEYDILMGALNGFAETLSMEGMLANLKNVPYLDLEKPWYDQKANEQLAIANKLYVTISDIGIVDKNATWSYLFNKRLVQDFSLEDPYKLVRDGSWTIDKMLEMCKDVSRDVDGDGIMGMNDMYGYAGETYNLYIALLSAGSELIKKDENDLPVYVGLDDMGVTVFLKLMAMFGDKTLTLRADDYYSSGKEVWGGNGVMDTAFKEDRILFFDTSMARVTFYRNMESDFGIIPPPKRDAAQADYISTVSVRSTNSLAIPVTVSDFERTGIITDALAAESRYRVIPAYYEVQLKTKYARDDESAEMLDIIFAGRKFDVGLLYNWAGLTSKFEEAMQKNSADITSSLEKIQDKIIAAIDKTVAAYENFSN